MRAYHDLLKTILETGNTRGDRTGVGTHSAFGLQFRHNLQQGFPLITTKKLPWKSIVVELLWFLRGDTNIRYLLENGVHIWTADAYRMYLRKMQESGLLEVDKDEFERAILTDEAFCQAFGNLGPIYGAQWRRWGFHVDDSYGGKDIELDQIQSVIHQIRKNPEGRRHIVTAWNPAEIASMALPPCHCMFQFYVHDGRLSCHMYQRSADMFLGVPFNIASYALLTHIVAHQCALDVGDLIISFGDVHIYRNHLDALYEQLGRETRPLPTVDIMVSPVSDVSQYEPGDFRLNGYDPHPAIKAELNVGV